MGLKFVLFNNFLLLKISLRLKVLKNSQYLDIFAITNRPDSKGIETYTRT